MTVERIKSLPYPEKVDSIENIGDYLHRLYTSLNEETTERIEDFDILKLNNVPWVDVQSYNSFSDAVDGIGLSEKFLLISNEQAITANKTVPSNVTLWFLQGGSLNISSGKIVTINGHIEAGLYQIFSSSGAVVFGTSTREVHPQWFGTDVSSIVGSVWSPSFNTIPTAGTLMAQKDTRFTFTTLASKAFVIGDYAQYTLDPTDTPTAEVYGLNYEVRTTGSKNFPRIEGEDISVIHDGSGDITGAVGGTHNVEINSGAGDVPDVWGARNKVANLATNTIIHAYGAVNRVANDGAGHIGSVYATYSEIHTDNASGLIDNSYGEYIPDIVGAGQVTTQYGLYIENQTKGSTCYGIYAAGGQSYLADKVGIGVTIPVISGTGKLHMAANTFRLDTARTITNATDAGNAGEICWDTNYIYVCIATNSWKRATLSSW